MRDVAPQELGATVIRELVARTGLTADRVDDVIFGHCYPTMDAPAIGRVAALDAGLEVSVPGIQVDRRCGSGLQAVLYAAMAVQSGGASLVLAGGAESIVERAERFPRSAIPIRKYWKVKGATGANVIDIPRSWSGWMPSADWSMRYGTIART